MGAFPAGLHPHPAPDLPLCLPGPHHRVLATVAAQHLDASDGVPLLARRLLSEEETDALLAEGRVVMLTDQYAPVEQMLAPVFLDQVPK